MKEISDIKIFFFVLLFLMFNDIFSQAETIQVNNPIYPFLKKLYLQNIIEQYDDLVLPVTKNYVMKKLVEIESKKSLLSTLELQKFKYFQEQYNVDFADSIYILSNNNFYYYLHSSQENYLFLFKDNSFNFSINPRLEFTNYYGKNKFEINNSTLGIIGGDVKLNYSHFLTATFSGWNGKNFGNRNIAKLDNRVEQSFAFNDTNLDFFDGTTGYVRYEDDFFSLQFGREKILWGTGYEKKLLLNGTSQNFDFLKFDFNYKFLSYKFINGWLVQLPIYLLDSSFNQIKLKNQKNISISRFGIDLKNISIGIAQAIIYSNRSFDPAYLNPFLFWESAQRSLGDLDNGFLGFDFKYKIRNGIAINSTFLFDDLNFGLWFQKKWNTMDNRLAFQIGFDLTSPIIFNNFFISLNYFQVRPYTFSHTGLTESLSYTNNGFPLGINIEPNSHLISLNINYDLFYNTSIYFNYEHYLHGANKMDSLNNVIQNVGGSYSLSTRFQDSREVHLLDGNLEITNLYSLKILYYLSYNFSMAAHFYFKNLLTINNSIQKNFIMFSIKIGY